MTIRAVIFDMDGVLIDSEPVWQESELAFFHQIGLREVTPEDILAGTGLPALTSIKNMYNKYGKSPLPLEVAATQLNNLAIELILTKKPLMEGVKETLAMLKSLNIKIAIASASPAKLLQGITQSCGIDGYFSYLSSATELEYNKPHPAVYLQAAKMLGVAAHECIGVEDSIVGMTAVKAANMKCIAIPAQWQADKPQWSLADVKLNSLFDITPSLLEQLDR